MPKATIQFLIDSGFRAEQFDGAADFAVPATGYLARVLDEAEGLVRANVGNLAYDSVPTDSVQALRLTRAEQCAARAELWARRAAFIDGSSAQGMDSSAWQERREYLHQADVAAAECSAWLDAFLAGGESPGEAAISDLASSVVVTGPWPQASAP